MHSRGRRALQDVLTATRIGTTVEQAGLALFPNGERHLRPIQRIAELHPPELLAASLEIASRCTFSLDELRYEYPREIVPEGYTPAAWLRRLTEEGAQPPLAGRRARRDATGDRARARADRRARVRAVLPHRARHRAVRALAAHPLPGPRLGGELGGVLLPRHHRGRSRAHVAAVRALHLQGAQRAARHRRRLRARAARGSHPVHLREVRPRARGAGRDGHQLPAAQRAARRGEGHGARSAAGRGARALDAVVGRLAHRRDPRARSGPRSGTAPCCRRS